MLPPRHGCLAFENLIFLRVKQGFVDSYHMDENQNIRKLLDGVNLATSRALTVTNIICYLFAVYRKMNIEFNAD